MTNVDGPSVKEGVIMRDPHFELKNRYVILEGESTWRGVCNK